jgi:hypothetical protein
MRRVNTQPGARFTVRGQRYVQVGSFLYDMDSGNTVRILELKTECPECGGAFELTASLGQIEKRMLIRRCERCRKTHRGPVDVRKLERRKAENAVKRRRRTSAAKSRPKKIAARPADAFSGAPEGKPSAPASSPPVTPTAAPETEMDTYRLALGMIA